jgi:molybdopterin/thiamine biosynthesis adenylyltransferase
MYRIGEQIDLGLLATKTVAIIGAGSVGGYAAQFLPYPLGKLYLIDHETLERQNIERHLAGEPHLGTLKAQAVRAIVSTHHGVDESRIVALHGKGQFKLRQIEDADVIIETSNNTPLRYHLNAWAIEHNKPVVYPGVYAGGNGWQTVCLPRPSEVCYSCFELSRSLEEPEYPDEAYGIPLYPREQLEGAVGLVPAVAQASSMAAKMATDILMGRTPESHAFRFDFSARKILESGDALERDRAEALALLAEHFNIGQYRFDVSGEGFTLSQEGGSIRFNIRQAPGCPLHSAQ